MGARSCCTFLPAATGVYTVSGGPACQQDLRQLVHTGMVVQWPVLLLALSLTSNMLRMMDVPDCIDGDLRVAKRDFHSRGRESAALIASSAFDTALDRSSRTRSICSAYDLA